MAVRGRGKCRIAELDHHHDEREGNERSILIKSKENFNENLIIWKIESMTI